METYILYVIIALLLGWTLKFYKHIKRKNLKVIEYLELINHSNKFSLYLRSFEDDGKSRLLPVSLFTLTLQGSATYEEEIVNIFKNQNLIAVGKPNEKLPELGAKRLYISDETWKEKVSNLVDHASIIIIKPNFSEGLVWEFNLLLEKRCLNKAIFYHHFKNESNLHAQKFYYNKFKELFSEKFGIELLDYSSKARFSYFMDDLSHRQVRFLKEIPIIKRTHCNST